jgi:hypothetical protein
MKNHNEIYKEMIKNWTMEDYEQVATIYRDCDLTESVRLSEHCGTKIPVIAIQNKETGKIYFMHNGEIIPFKMAIDNHNGTYNLYEITVTAATKAGF